MTSQTKAIVSKEKKARYWYEQLDGFGLFFAGVFFGALLELTEIRTLGIVIGTTGATCIVFLMWFIKSKCFKNK